MGLLYGTVPTFTPYTQERWELVEYVSSTVVDDVSQTVWRESSVTGDLADVYGVSRLSTTGGREGLSVSDTYLEDGLGSVSAVLREGGSVAASYAYGPWGAESQAMESVPGIGSRFELPHYGYNAEEASPATGSQYLRARWYDPSMGAFGSQDTYLGDSADPSTLNRYAYAEGNPVAFSDPTGHVTAARNRQKKQQAATQRARQAAKGRSAATKKSGISSLVKTVTSKAARVQGKAKAANPDSPTTVTGTFTPAIINANKPPSTITGSFSGEILARMSTSRANAQNAKYSSYPNRLGSSSLLSRGRGVSVSTLRGTYRLGAYSTSYKRGVGAILALCNNSAKQRDYGISATKVNTLDVVHLGLGAAGQVPVLGEGFDFVDAVVSFLEGDSDGVMLSLGAMLPGAGAASGGAKAAKKFAKIAKATEVMSDIAKGSKKVDLSSGLLRQTVSIDSIADGQRMTTGEAMDLAIGYLGPGYKDTGGGRFVSADGMRVVRMKDSDIAGHYPDYAPHFNFESME